MGLLVGSEAGIHGIDGDGAATPLWTDGAVRKLLRAGETHAGARRAGRRRDDGPADLGGAEHGPPVKTLKRYRNGLKTFDRVIQELKDLEADPADPRILVPRRKTRSSSRATAA
jgi:hypothetical protein